jgi:hypothetical protein
LGQAWLERIVGGAVLAQRAQHAAVAHEGSERERAESRPALAQKIAPVGQDFVVGHPVHGR